MTNLFGDDWTSTFHKIPKLLDASFASNGATRISKIGLVDVASDDVFNEFDKWQDEVFWPALGASVSDELAEPELEIDTASRGSTLRQDVQEAVVLSNEVLTRGTEPQKRYISLRLPTDMVYKAGDYLKILKKNHDKPETWLLLGIQRLKTSGQVVLRVRHATGFSGHIMVQDVDKIEKAKTFS